MIHEASKEDSSICSKTIIYIQVSVISNIVLARTPPLFPIMVTPGRRERGGSPARVGSSDRAVKLI